MIFLLYRHLLWLESWSIIARYYFFQFLLFDIYTESPLVAGFTLFYNFLADFFLNFLSFWFELQHLNGLGKLTNRRFPKVEILRLAPRKRIQQDTFILHNTIISNTKLVISKQGQFIDIRPHS